VVEGRGDRLQVRVAVLGAIDPTCRPSRTLHAWLDTHTVFVAAMAALVLGALGDAIAASARRCPAGSGHATGLRLPRSAGGSHHTAQPADDLRPGALPIAALYWTGCRPVVQVSDAPHATATRTTEQRAVAAHALDLAGHGPGLYRQAARSFGGT
jgi:2-dehydropantoate 2-reductase